MAKGTYQGNPVAIKMLKNHASQNLDYLRSLLGELKVMSYLGSHPNLVGLIGAMTANIKRGEVYLIFELCSKGNAHKFVRTHRENFVDNSVGSRLSNRLPMQPGTRYVVVGINFMQPYYISFKPLYVLNSQASAGGCQITLSI